MCMLFILYHVITLLFQRSFALTLRKRKGQTRRLMWRSRLRRRSDLLCCLSVVELCLCYGSSSLCFSVTLVSLNIETSRFPLTYIFSFFDSVLLCHSLGCFDLLLRKSPLLLWTISSLLNVFPFRLCWSHLSVTSRLLLRFLLLCNKFSSPWSYHVLFARCGSRSPSNLGFVFSFDGFHEEGDTYTNIYSHV